MKDFGQKIAEWAAGEPSIEAIALIGSRVRDPEDPVWRADAQSDWDFHVLSSRPELFNDKGWTRQFDVTVQAYAVRRAALGGVPKVAAVFDGAEADFVLLPLPVIEPLRTAVAAGQHRNSPQLVRTLQDLAIVIRPGWRFLKGAEKWDPFYRQVVADIGDPRLSDEEVCNLAEGFVCDALWTLRKIERGEFVAAYRMLHRALAETNFQLLHEIKLRRGERSFPEARRIERIGTPEEVFQITLSAEPDAAELYRAVDKAYTTCRDFVRVLVGDTWRAPELPTKEEAR